LFSRGRTMGMIATSPLRRLEDVTMDDAYEEIRDHFAGVEGVTVNSGRGSQGIKVGAKMLVMFYKGDLLAQLPPERVRQLIDSAEGLPFDPGTGKVMSDRILIPVSMKDSWIRIAEESVGRAGSH
jgi:hypothetical protein